MSIIEMLSPEQLAALSPEQLAALSGGASDTPSKGAKGKASTASKAKVIAFPTHGVKVGDVEYRATVALESRNSKGEVTTKYAAPRVVLMSKAPGADDFRKVTTIPQGMLTAMRELSDAAVRDLTTFAVEA